MEEREWKKREWGGKRREGERKGEGERNKNPPSDRYGYGPDRWHCQMVSK